MVSPDACRVLRYKTVYQFVLTAYILPATVVAQARERAHAEIDESSFCV